MSVYQIREGKPQIGYYTDEKVTKEEYDTMHLYQMRTYWIRQQIIISFPDNPDNNLDNNLTSHDIRKSD